MRAGRTGALLRPRLLAAVLALTSGVFPKAAAAQGPREGEVVVDRVVAVVERGGGEATQTRMVTAVELDIEARLVLAERARDVEAARVAPTEGLLRAVLTAVTDELLIDCESARLELVTVTDADVRRERDEAERHLGGPGALDRFVAITGAPADLVDAVMRRRATVARFVEANGAFAVRVTQAEVEEAFRTGDHPFVGRPIEEVRDQIEAIVAARRQQELLSQWLAEMRRRSRVRLLLE